MLYYMETEEKKQLKIKLFSQDIVFLKISLSIWCQKAVMDRIFVLYNKI